MIVLDPSRPSVQLRPAPAGPEPQAQQVVGGATSGPRVARRMDESPALAEEEGSATFPSARVPLERRSA